MSEARTIGLRLGERDASALSYLHRATGIKSASELLRLLIHREARSKGWDQEDPPEADADETMATGTDG